MNDARRKELTNAISALEQAKATIESVATEEQDSYDNLSDSLQESPNGQKMQEAIEALEQACSDIDDALSNIETAKE